MKEVVLLGIIAASVNEHHVHHVIDSCSGGKGISNGERVAGKRSPSTVHLAAGVVDGSSDGRVKSRRGGCCV